MYHAHPESVLSTLYADGHHSCLFITKSWEQFKYPVTEDKLWCYPASNTSDVSEGVFVAFFFM